MIDLTPACHRMIDLLADVADDQLTSPTPCAEYTVGDVIDHVDQLSQGFTALAHKESTDADTGGEPTAANLGDGWRDTVAEHLRRLGEAWSNAAAWQGKTVAAGLDMPNELWGKIALTEVVVHGWDLATATGQPFDLPEETLQSCFDHVAGFVPNAPIEGLWGPAVEVPTEAPLLDRVVAVTGRNPAPGWQGRGDPSTRIVKRGMGL